jgi:phosphatidate cytidylyltransferase
VNLVWRLALGFLFTGALVGLCWADARLEHPGMIFLPVAIGLSVLAADELWQLAAARGLRPHRAATLLGSAAVVASNAAVVYWPLGGTAYPADCPIGKFGWPLAASAVGLMLAFGVEMRRYRAPGESIANVAAAALSLIYVGAFMSLLVHLRLLGGLLPLVSLVAVVKACDVGAYTVGRLCGRHKMSPVISPGKTIEGALGGVALACVASYLTLRFMGSTASTGGIGWLIYGAIVGFTGMMGDLAESLLKRDAGVKDSSRWMPGFGGVLDVLDSILFAAPVAFLLWAAGVVKH